MNQTSGFIIKKFIKKILWAVIPKKNGTSLLKVLGGPDKGVLLNLDLRLEGSYWLGNYDKWIFDSVPFEDYIKTGDVVWDGGAYVGYYTAYFRKLVGDTGIVHSFEASRRNYNRLSVLPANNNWSNVIIHNLAIGPDHTQISFVDNLGGSNGPYGLTKTYDETGVPVSVTTVQSCGVDELISDKKIDEPDFIKFDLETAEEYALKNGDKVFRVKRPVILLELHGEKAKQSAGIFLEEYNYEGLLMDGLKERRDVIRSQDDLNRIEYVPHMLLCLPL